MIHKQSQTKRRNTTNNRAKKRARKTTAVLAGNALSNLRRRYFSHAAESAARYGVSFDRIVQHLWDVRHRRLHIPLRSIVCVDDLVHVVGCLDQCARAWHDLIDLYEPWLVRQHRCAVGPCTALLEVRQFFIELRRDVYVDTADVSLHDYLGIEPLRFWLAGNGRLTDRFTDNESRWAVGARS